MILEIEIPDAEVPCVAAALREGAESRRGLAVRGEHADELAASVALLDRLAGRIAAGRSTGQRARLTVESLEEAVTAALARSDAEVLDPDVPEGARRGLSGFLVQELERRSVVLLTAEERALVERWQHEVRPLGGAPTVDFEYEHEARVELLAHLVGGPPSVVVPPRTSSLPPVAAPGVDDGARLRRAVHEVVLVTLPGHGGWCFGSEHPDTQSVADRVSRRVVERLAGWASSPRLRELVSRVAGDVLDHPDTRVVRSFDTAVAIAERVVEELARNPAVSAEDSAEPGEDSGAGVSPREATSSDRGWRTAPPTPAEAAQQRWWWNAPEGRPPWILQLEVSRDGEILVHVGPEGGVDLLFDPAEWPGAWAPCASPEDPGVVAAAIRHCTERLAEAMGVHVLGRTYEGLLADVSLNLRDARRLLRMSQALGEVAREVGLPLLEERPSRVVAAVRETLAGLRREIEQLGRETTMAQLVTGLLVATDPVSTGGMRDRVRRELLAWAPRGAAASVATRDALLASSVDDLDLSVRAANLLLGMGIRTLGELVSRTGEDLRRQGDSRFVRELSEELGKLGLALTSPPAAPGRAAKPGRRAASGGKPRG